MFGVAALMMACVADPGPRAPGVQEQASPRINNGFEAQSCQWPSTVALLNGSPFCSGTLIHPRFVLTAAHCLNNQTPSQIGFGEDGFNMERTVGVAGCTSHPEYGAGLDVDLAVCELVEPVTDVQTVPILLGCEQQVLESKDPHIEIAGFGNTQTVFLDWQWYEGFGLGPKRYVSQSIYEMREAEQEIDLEGVGVMSGACHGDSGGPAFVQLDDGSWRVFAVAQSWNNVPGDPNDAGTSTGGSATTSGGQSSSTDDGGGQSRTTDDGGGSIGATTLADDGGGAISTSDGGGGFIDPTGSDDVGFIVPDDGGDGFVDTCGHGTTYSLIAPQMAWIEDVIGEDTSACFTPDGAWDPGPACTPFPLQLDQSVGTWANGCVGALGGEPQCGELGPVGGSTDDGASTEDTGPGDGDTSSGDGHTTGVDETADDSGDTDPDPAGTDTIDPGGEGTAAAGDGSGDDDGTDGDGDPAASGEGAGCGCRHNGKAPLSLWLAVFGLALVRRRGD